MFAALRDFDAAFDRLGINCSPMLANAATHFVAGVARKRMCVQLLCAAPEAAAAKFAAFIRMTLSAVNTFIFRMWISLSRIRAIPAPSPAPRAETAPPPSSAGGSPPDRGRNGRTPRAWDGSPRSRRDRDRDH